MTGSGDIFENFHRIQRCRTSATGLEKAMTNFIFCSMRSICKSICVLVHDASLTLPSLATRQSSQMASQEQLLRSTGGGSEQGVLKLQEANVHFMTPQSVSNLFVGREFELSQLKQDLKGRGPAEGTTRVVVHGLNGSGKTQFCCKFAQDNRSR